MTILSKVKGTLMGTWDMVALPARLGAATLAYARNGGDRMDVATVATLAVAHAIGGGVVGGVLTMKPWGILLGAAVNTLIMMNALAVCGIKNLGYQRGGLFSAPDRLYPHIPALQK